MQITLKNTDFFNRAISELKSGIKEETLFKIGKITGDAMGTFAPEDTGALKKDYHIDIYKNAVGVTWGYKGSATEDYAHYQYEGKVYSPNVPVINGNTGRFVGWISPVVTKKRTSRNLGTPGSMTLSNGEVVEFGYSTPGSSSRWIEKARNTSTVYYPMRREVYEILADAIGEKIVVKRYFT